MVHSPSIHRSPISSRAGVLHPELSSFTFICASYNHAFIQQSSALNTRAHRNYPLPRPRSRADNLRRRNVPSRHLGQQRPAKPRPHLARASAVSRQLPSELQLDRRSRLVRPLPPRDQAIKPNPTSIPSNQNTNPTLPAAAPPAQPANTPRTNKSAAAPPQPANAAARCPAAMPTSPHRSTTRPRRRPGSRSPRRRTGTAAEAARSSARATTTPPRRSSSRAGIARRLLPRATICPRRRRRGAGRRWLLRRGPRGRLGGECWGWWRRRFWARGLWRGDGDSERRFWLGVTGCDLQIAGGVYIGGLLCCF